MHLSLGRAIEATVTIGAQGQEAPRKLFVSLGKALQSLHEDLFGEHVFPSSRRKSSRP